MSGPATLVAQFYVDDVLVDEVILANDATLADHAERHADLALAARRRWRLVIIDPEGDIPSFMLMEGP